MYILDNVFISEVSLGPTASSRRERSASVSNLPDLVQPCVVRRRRLVSAPGYGNLTEHYTNVGQQLRFITDNFLAETAPPRPEQPPHVS